MPALRRPRPRPSPPSVLDRVRQTRGREWTAFVHLRPAGGTEVAALYLRHGTRYWRITGKIPTFSAHCMLNMHLAHRVLDGGSLVKVSLSQLDPAFFSAAPCINEALSVIREVTNAASNNAHKTA